MSNYTILHLHSDLSNGVTNIDSVTKFTEYIDRAKELDMKALAFTEHGNVFEYYKKHSYCKQKGIKYIHGIEMYVTESTTDKVRDNYHCCLYALNYEGFLEINKLSTISFNRNDGHYYYSPRITFEELYNTSNNVAISTACIGGVFKTNNKDLKVEFTKFLARNKHRCFLEIQHHLDEKQIKHNKLMYEISKGFNIPMLVATDTHALNETHSKGRTVLQKSKDIYFDDESGWDITMKSYDDLIDFFKKQNAIPMDKILEALENTNKLADMVEEYDFDASHKYPKLYKNSFDVFLAKIREGIVNRGIDKLPNYKEYQDRIIEEIDVYVKVNAVDYMLLQAKIIEDAKSIGGVQHGYGRGSVTGSIIAYLLNITEMDSVKYKLNFFRFLNPSRVTNADIDCDFGEEDRAWVRNYLFNMNGITAVDIITFNTIALKGSIRDVCKALYFAKDDTRTYLKIANYICDNVEIHENRMREEYPEIFKYVDIINGTIVSVGSHPSGVLVSDLEIDKLIGLCTLSGNPNYVTQLSMKPLDALFYVKLDVLGLDSINIINETCRLANIERLTPDNIDIYDNGVWKDIREDTTAIFQMESSMAHKYFKDITRKDVIEKIKKSIPNIRMFDLFMFICGAIRPAGENFRDDASNGIIKDNGFEELNEFLHSTLGYLLLQEQIMQFLVKFCGYSDAESDNVRRAIAKKGDTTPMLKEIEERFLEYTPRVYNVDLEKAKEIIKPFLLDIKSASGYGFSENHNNPYSLTGYSQGWLRHYYPLEFITSCLNIWSSKEDKVIRVTEYANKKGITINPPKFRYSKGKYHPNKDNNSIYKGIGSIKYCNESIGNELYALRDKKYNNFVELLDDISNNTSIDNRQIDILITLNYFSEFGKRGKLLNIVKLYNSIKNKKQFKKDNLPCSEELIRKYSEKETEKMYTKVNVVGLLNDMIPTIEDTDISIRSIFEAELEYVGYISFSDGNYKDNIAVISDINENKWGSVFATLYYLNNGKTESVKINKKYYATKPIDKYDVIAIVDIQKVNKKRKIDGKWQNIEETETVLNSYGMVI